MYVVISWNESYDGMLTDSLTRTDGINTGLRCSANFASKLANVSKPFRNVLKTAVEPMKRKRE